MGLTNLLDDTAQIIMEHMAEKVTLLHLSQLQRANIKLFILWCMVTDYFLSGDLQH